MSNESAGFSVLDAHPSVQRNYQPVAQVLDAQLRASDRVLEIGAGRGEHISLLAQRLAFRLWQCTEQPAMLDVLRDRLRALDDARVPPPHALTVGSESAPAFAPTVILTVNTLHIMRAESVPGLIDAAARWLASDGRLIVYGPFRIGGQHISDGNEAFDASLRSAGCGQAIPDLDTVTRWAADAGFAIRRRYAMPANNCMLVWERAP